MQSLADAIIAEHSDQVLQYMHAGFQVNQLDEYGFTPLIEAAIADNIDIAKILLENGADPNLQDLTGGSALHWAAENNNIELAKLLLRYRADPNLYTFAGQPILVMPLLRHQNPIKKLLLQSGADLEFAQDYINTKVLGHMFELVGTANIIDPNNQFVEVDFEGFYLEFSLAIIAESLSQFKNHFAARDLRRYAQFSQVIVETINRAAHLIKYQQYRVDVKQYRSMIQQLIHQEPMIIPIGYEGHAITFIKAGNIFVKCDRREDSRLYDNIMFYHINHPQLFTDQFIQDLVFEKQSGDFINHDLHRLLDLKPITEIKVTAQISGNCSWANVEACIPALFFLLFSQTDEFEKNMSRFKNIALNYFQQWREWNKDRALNFCIQSFKQANVLRKACKAEILGAILFQSCKMENTKDRGRIESILEVLATPQYDYVIQNYIKTYCYEDISDDGKHFMRMLQSYGYQR